MAQIVTLNALGLGDPLKRRSIFNYYRTRANIICLQETHSKKEDESVWSAEWGGNITFSHGSSNARGVCILFAPKLPYHTVSTVCSPDGRYIVTELENIDDPTLRFTLCNIYAPNNDAPQFLLNVLEAAKDKASEIIIIGDYNLVMDPQMDRIGNKTNPIKAKMIVDQITEEMSLCDIWRIRNPTTKTYSWLRTKPEISASRLDFALVSQGLTQHIELTMYIPGIKSDHTAFYMYLNQSHTERGRGYWKFNTRLLRDKQYVNGMNECLDKKLLESTEMDKVERWIFLKNSAAEFSKIYSKKTASDNELIISQLSERITEMLSREEKNECELEIIQNSQKDLDDLLEQKTQGVMFRTKSKWYEYGETSSKTFFNMEKRRYSAKTCTKLILENTEELVTNPQQIIREQYKFYQELYRADTNIQIKVDNKSDIKLTSQ